MSRGISLIGIVGIIWIIFWVYWMISSFSSKRTVRRNHAGWYIRVVLAIFIIYLLIGGFSMQGSNIFNVILFAGNWSVQIVAFIAFIGGLAIAVWARIYLGRNWGMPMSLKENPELVTSGPYRFIRHPIYTGVLLAMLATGFIATTVWLLVFVLFGIYFVYAAHAEDRLMAEQFPAQYPAYRTRTKMIFPGIY